tara:strand:- start:166 stop:597 length:432 start_codon:yes stop_codon:yes gene_type:complete
MAKSPAKLGMLGSAGTLLKGFKNRKEYGGGLKGMAEATAAQATGEHTDNKLDTIISKLDAITSGASGDTAAAPNPNQPLFSPATGVTAPLTFTETTQQNPSTNGTGGGTPTFNPDKANLMSSVADPEQDTKDALFNRKLDSIT